jgi:hypothetical protein
MVKEVGTMNDFYTTLPNTMRQLKQIEAELENTLAKLRGLKNTIAVEIPQLETWSAPSNLMDWHELSPR